MKLSAILAPLIAAGVSGDVILATVKAFEEQQNDALEKRREADRVRQDRKRQADKSRDVTLRHSDSLLTCGGDTRGDVKQNNLEIPNSKKEEEVADKPRSDLACFKSELAPILNQERIDAIVSLRRKKKATMNAYAARLLTKALKACPDINAAADEMIVRNWTSVKPEWLSSGNQSAAPSRGPPPRERTIFDAIDDFTGRNDHELPASKTIDHDDGGDHPPNVHLLAPAQRGRR